MIEVYKEGYYAYCEGVQYSENPYYDDPDPHKYRWWNTGWVDAADGKQPKLQ